MMMTKKKIAVGVILLGLLGVVAVVARVRSRHIDIWLASYLQQAAPEHPPTDVMFLIADHYEPGEHDEIVTEWLRRYPELFGAIRDSDGRPPRHTFFYPAEQFKLSQVQALNELVRGGYGEIELHLHHKGDTSATLREKIRQAKRDFAAAGALQTADGQPHFAFVHGNWALDNSVPERCGVNDELTILREEGGFADFTFPAYETAAQPPLVNRIYYAIDDPAQPKSYATGRVAEAGKSPTASEFMVFEGPLGLRWFQPWYRIFPVVEYGGMEGERETAPDSARLATWLAANVHVQGRPEWIFVKWHTHGAYSRDKASVLSPAMAELYRRIVAYGREHNLRIHFVTAREAYNIAKAAETGKTGDAGAFRDFLVPQYANVAAPPTSSK